MFTHSKFFKKHAFGERIVNPAKRRRNHMRLVVAEGLENRLLLTTALIGTFSGSMPNNYSTPNTLLDVCASFYLNNKDTVTTADDDLLIHLQNNTAGGAAVPSDALTGVYFDVAGTPTLTPGSVHLATGSTILNDELVVDVGGEFAFESGSLTPQQGSAFTQQYGVSSSGLGIFGDSNFPLTANLDDNNAIAGLGYAIVNGVSSSANPTVQSASLISNAVDIVLHGYSGGAISNVSFQFGTAGNEPRINVPDTTTNSVNLSGSTVLEGPNANYTFTATLSSPSQGVTTIVTDQGTITIADGQSTGTLVIASGNTEDVYKDASSLTATITSAAGSNFETLVVGPASATAQVNDTIDTATVNLTGSASFYDDAGHYTLTATLTSPSQGVTTIVTDQGTITIVDGQSTGTLSVMSFALSMTVAITSVTGGNFEAVALGKEITLSAPTATLTVSGIKYDDLDGDGAKDAGEFGIMDWTIAVTYTSWSGVKTVAVTTTTDGAYHFTAEDAVVGTSYSVQEVNPNTAVWQETEGLAGYSGTVDVLGNNVTSVDFGNHYRNIDQAGLTIGFWSNKNGAKIISANGAQSGDLKAEVFAQLQPLNLRNADGSLLIKPMDTSLATKTFQSWLTAANAKNMANMLSAQLAGTVLNVYKQFVNAGLYVDFSAVTKVGSGAHLTTDMLTQLNAHGLGTRDLELATVSDIIAKAKSELGLHSTTILASNERTYQEALKDIFDAINNNETIFTL